MNIVEIVNLVVFPCLYAVMSIIANRYPKSKVGKACAIAALVTKHKLTPKD